MTILGPNGPASCVRNLCDWTQVEYMLHALPENPIKSALIRAFADIMRTRPESVIVATQLLRGMKCCIAAARECLALHDKRDMPDASYQQSNNWFDVEFDWMTEGMLKAQDRGSVVDGASVLLERNFFSSRGQVPLRRDQMLKVAASPNGFGRVAKQRYSGMLVGQYLCDFHDDALRILSWSVREQANEPQRAVPEKMVDDLFRFLTTGSPAKKFQTIDCAVLQIHTPPPKPVLSYAPDDNTKRKFFL